MMTMAIHTRGVNASVPHDRMEIFDKNAVEVSPTHRVFKTVGTILALAGVSARVFFPPFDPHRHAIGTGR